MLARHIQVSDLISLEPKMISAPILEIIDRIYQIIVTHVVTHYNCNPQVHLYLSEFPDIIARLYHRTVTYNTANCYNSNIRLNLPNQWSRIEKYITIHITLKVAPTLCIFTCALSSYTTVGTQSQSVVCRISLLNVTPIENECPGLVIRSSYRTWIFFILTWTFRIICVVSFSVRESSTFFFGSSCCFRASSILLSIACFASKLRCSSFSASYWICWVGSTIKYKPSILASTDE